MAAGMMAPPNALRIGSAAWRGVESPPLTTSRLISRPTRRKKIAMRPSLIHKAAEYFNWTALVSNPSDRFKRDSKAGPAGEFARASDRRTHRKSIIPPLDDELRIFPTIFNIVKCRLVQVQKYGL